MIGKSTTPLRYVIFAKKKFDSSSRLYKKVVDHDHVTGNIVQAAHSICNLQRQGPFRTPIYFHNAKG